jgi:nicotinate-nucleotide adenylyltransferase
VWLLVSPGNPLKPSRGMAKYRARFKSARAIADGRRIVAAGLERAWHTRYTVDTLDLLHRRFPHVCFVLVIGADLLEELPRWRRWRDVSRLIPIAVLPRPSYNHRALAGQAAQALRGARIPAHAARSLACRKPPAWTFLGARQTEASATAIRAARRGGRS